MFNSIQASFQVKQCWPRFLEPHISKINVTVLLLPRFLHSDKSTYLRPEHAVFTNFIARVWTWYLTKLQRAILRELWSCHSTQLAHPDRSSTKLAALGDSTAVSRPQLRPVQSEPDIWRPDMLKGRGNNTGSQRNSSSQFSCVHYPGRGVALRALCRFRHTSSIASNSVDSTCPESPEQPAPHSVADSWTATESNRPI